MRRLVLVSVATLSLVGGISGTSAMASASTAPPMPSDGATAVDPIVGTWTLIDVSDPESPPFTGAFLPEGVYLEVDTGDVAIGVWEATGPDTVAMSYTSWDDEGSFTVRASITVDGDNLSADYTLQFVGDVAASGEYGPGQVTGFRADVSQMGTPIGSLDELLSSFAQGTEVPESTSVALAAPKDGLHSALTHRHQAP
jgi:hypothetical protein